MPGAERTAQNQRCVLTIHRQGALAEPCAVTGEPDATLPVRVTVSVADSSQVEARQQDGCLSERQRFRRQPGRGVYHSG